MGPKAVLTSCPRDVFRDAIRFSVIAKAGGKQVMAKRTQLSGSPEYAHSSARILEYAVGGMIVARLVEACGRVECWIRPDLATETLIARADDQAENERIIDAVGRFIKETDEQGAQRHGISVEQYRAMRHAAGARWDNYRARQRAGGF